MLKFTVRTKNNYSRILTLQSKQQGGSREETKSSTRIRSESLKQGSGGTAPSKAIAGLFGV